VPAGAPVCARTQTGSVIPTITAGGPALDGAIPVTGSTTGTVTTDQVVVPAGRAALVSRLTADRTPTGGRYPVADDGRRFAVPTDATAASLDYGGVTPVGIPGPLLDLLPTGPARDPATAGHAPAESAAGPQQPTSRATPIAESAMP